MTKFYFHSPPLYTDSPFGKAVCGKFSSCMTVMFYSQKPYVSVNSKPDHPLPGQTPGKIFERENSPPPGTKKVRKFDLWGREIVLKPHHRGNYFQKSSKKYRT